MSEHSYCSRLSIAVIGEVDTGVETHTNTDDAGGSWVLVRTGPVLSYCEHPAHVIRAATAWSSALIKARQILPTDSHLCPIPRDRVIAQVTAQDADTWDVSGYAASAAGDGVAVLFVRVGAVTFRCYDQAVVETMQQTWRDAAMVAHLMWRPKRKVR